MTTYCFCPDFEHNSVFDPVVHTTCKRRRGNYSPLKKKSIEQRHQKENFIHDPTLLPGACSHTAKRNSVKQFRGRELKNTADLSVVTGSRVWVVGPEARRFVKQ